MITTARNMADIGKIRIHAGSNNRHYQGWYSSLGGGRLSGELAILTERRGVPMCQVVEFGRCADGIYCIQSWINGEDAEAAIPRLSSSRQYALRLEAGEILKSIHSIPAPHDQPDWETYFNVKAVPAAFWKLLAL